MLCTCIPTNRKRCCANITHHLVAPAHLISIRQRRVRVLFLEYHVALFIFFQFKYKAIRTRRVGSLPRSACHPRDISRGESEEWSRRSSRSPPPSFRLFCGPPSSVPPPPPKKNTGFLDVYKCRPAHRPPPTTPPPAPPRPAHGRQVDSTSLPCTSTWTSSRRPPLPAPAPAAAATKPARKSPPRPRSWRRLRRKRVSFNQPAATPSSIPPASRKRRRALTFPRAQQRLSCK